MEEHLLSTHQLQHPTAPQNIAANKVRYIRGIIELVFTIHIN